MKLFRTITLLVLAWFLVVLAYGIIMFPDAPFKACEGGLYCGKQQKRHTQEQYEEFQLWQSTLFISFPFAALAAFLRKKKAPNPEVPN